MVREGYVGRPPVIFSLEHDLVRKPVSTLGSGPRAGFCGIMLYTARLNVLSDCVR